MVARVKGLNKDFNRIEVDSRKAFDLMPNIFNTESVLFNDSNDWSSMVKAMALPRYQHVMCHNEKTTLEFVEKLCESLKITILNLSNML